MPTRPLSELEAVIGESRVTAEEFRVEAGKVAEFARAVTDPNPVFRSTEAAIRNDYQRVPAPPTFTRVGSFPRYTPDDIEGHGFDLGFRPEHVLHGEHAYEYERPVFVGDVLTGTTTLTDLYERDGGRAGTMTFAILETAYRDQHGELVLTDRATVIETDGAVTTTSDIDDAAESASDETAESSGVESNSDGERVRTRTGRGPATGQEYRVRSMDELEEGDNGPSIVVENVERQDFVRYAGASGDFNPIHYDEPYARSAGNETAFGQGMFTAGITSRVVTDWFGVDALESFGVRFRSRLFPGDTVTASGTVEEIERDDRTVEVDLETTTQNDETVLTGAATATLPVSD